MDRYGFSTQNVGGFDANALGGSEDIGGGAGLGPVSFGSDPVGELAYLQTQQNQINQQIAAERAPELNNPNLYAANLNALGTQIQANQTPGGVLSTGSNAVAASAFGGAGITPYMPAPVVMAAPVINTMPINFGTFGGTFF